MRSKWPPKLGQSKHKTIIRKVKKGRFISYLLAQGQWWAERDIIQDNLPSERVA
jgi:hypothetical protein